MAILSRLHTDGKARRLPGTALTYMLFAVWGERFIDKFASLTMASLLSPGNLPTLAKTHQLQLIFHTDRSSVAYLKIRMAPLEEYADLTIVAFEDTTVDGRTVADGISLLKGPAVKHELERLVTFHTLDTVLDHGQGHSLFIIPSDLAASDGSFTRAQTLLDNGAEAVAPPVLRLSEDHVTFSGTQLRDGIDDTTICGALPESFQHITGSCIATSQNFSAYPASILWPVADDGFLCRTFFPLTLAFKPQDHCRRYDSSIDYDFLLNLVSDPAKIYIPASSAEICAMKVTGGDYMQRDSTAQPLRGAALAHFMLMETNKAHRSLFSRPYRLLKKAEDELDQETWRYMETESGRFVDSAYDFIDQIVAKVPKDTPGLAQSIGSHFGRLEDYLSPMRRPASN